MNVLVTGGCGFIGSNLVRWLLRERPAWQRALDGDGEKIDRGAIDRKLRSAREKLRKH